MQRRIVYPEAVATTARPIVEGKRAHVQPAADQTKDVDGYRDKLLKYVPVEATVFFALAYGKLADRLNSHSASQIAWWVVILVIGGAIALLFAGGATADQSIMPWYFYALTPIAFWAWAWGTTGIGQTLFSGWLTQGNDVVFAGAAFLIPGVDQWLTRHRVSKAHTRHRVKKTEPQA